MTQEEIAREAHKMILSFWEKDFDMHVLVDGVTITQTGRKLAWKDAKECAIIAVEKIVKVYEPLDEDYDIMFKTELENWGKIKEYLENA
jgi:hypothetical protein